MDISEYKNIFEQEDSHFYYKGYHRIVLYLLERYLPNKKIEILDAGCGTGLMAKRLEQFGQVEAIDINSEAVRYSRSRGIQVKKSSLLNIPFKDSCFDLIVCLDVLYHQAISSDTAALKELRRVLKPGGILLLKLPAHNWLKSSHDLHVQTRKRYEIKEIEHVLVKQGFETIYSSYLGSFLVIPQIIKNFLDQILKSNPSSSISSLWEPLNNLLSMLFDIELYIIKFAKIPQGISIIMLSKKTNRSKVSENGGS